MSFCGVNSLTQGWCHFKWKQKISKNVKPTFGILCHGQGSICNCTYSGDVVPFFRHQVFPEYGPTIRKCFRSGFGVLARPNINGTAAKSLLFCLQLVVVVVGNITTTLGFSPLGFWSNSPANSCGQDCSAFFLLRSIGVATRSPCRSRMAIK